MIGRVYLEAGEPVAILIAAKRRKPPTGRIAPFNVLVERSDGQRTVRPFRGLTTVR